MAVRDLVLLPDARLRAVSAPVGEVTDEVKKLADDMLETMYAAPGIGLAAIQIGIPRRIVTMDVSKKDEAKAPLVLIDPEILWKSEARSVYEEGCLSIPEYYEDVERPAEVVVRFRDRDGTLKEMRGDGLFATCVQHEIDHLDGVLFIDYLSRLKRERVVKKFTKAARRDDK
jgi:peptide deformylase